MRCYRPRYQHWLAVTLLAGLAACSGGSRARLNTVAGVYKVGAPYEIAGRWYYPTFDPSYDRTGVASWYGDDFRGEATANGETFDERAITAAHPTLPLPSIVRVTNLRNGRSLDVRVNDRGPFVGNRLIDLSQEAARELAFENSGLTPVRVQFVRLAPSHGTPPAPVVRLARRAVSPVTAARQLAAAPTTPRPMIVPVAATPASAGDAATRWCPAGPQFVQIGAFAEGSRVRQATSDLHGLAQLVVDPLFSGRQALARVRMGPVPTRADAQALLERVRALGYPQAVVVPAAAGAATAHC